MEKETRTRKSHMRLFRILVHSFRFIRAWVIHFLYSSSFISVITIFSAPTSVLRFTMSSIWAR